MGCVRNWIRGWPVGVFDFRGVGALVAAGGVAVIHMTNGQYSHVPQLADSSLGWASERVMPELTYLMEDLRERNIARNNEGDEIAGECPCSD